MSRARPSLLGILGSLFLLAACSEEPMAPEAREELSFEIPEPSLAPSDGGEVNTAISVTPIIQCGETGTVTVDIQGITPPPEEAPVEIMLVLDESGSIDNAEYSSVQSASNAFLEVIDQADGSDDNTLDAARIGTVKFASGATLRQPLTNSYPAVQASFPRFYPGGGTFMDQGLAVARNHLAVASRLGAERVVILFSDGIATNPGAATSQANLLKGQGVRIFTIGVGNGVNQNFMRSLATSPSDFVFVNNFSDLNAAFESIAGQVTFPAGTDVTFTADVPSGFTYVAGSASASKGTVGESGGTVTWTIDRLEAETATMTYDIQHDQGAAPSGGALTAVANAVTTFTTPKSLTPVSDPRPDVETQVDGCDTTPPEITPNLSGTLGDNDWYVSDVDLTWTVEDNESAITSQTGCDPQNVTTDGPAYSFTCEATSAGGTASETVEFKRDATDPEVTWTGNVGPYDIADDVAITCSTSDNLSGVAGDSCADIVGGAWEFALGSNSFSATATDNAGNIGQGATAFEVNASYDGLCALVEMFVDNKGVANSLCVKLAAAERAADRGNTSAQAGALGAFINEVEAQDGKKVPSFIAPVLVSGAQALMP